MGVKKYINITKPYVIISHTDYDGGTITIFEEAIKTEITKLYVNERNYIKTKLGVLPALTFELIKSNSSRILLRNTKCVSCRETVIMTHNNIENQETTTCPVCKGHIYKTRR
jgi:hypothetical protein